MTSDAHAGDVGGKVGAGADGALDDDDDVEPVVVNEDTATAQIGEDVVITSASTPPPTSPGPLLEPRNALPNDKSPTRV